MPAPLPPLSKVAVELGSRQRDPSVSVTPLPVNMANATNGIFEVDLSSAFNNSQIGAVQSIFVDNSDNPYSVDIILEQAGDVRITCPAGANGWFPLPVLPQARFSFETDYTGTIPTLLSTLAIPPHVWYPNGEGDGAGIYTDQTVIISNGGTESSVLTLGTSSPRRFILPVAFTGTELEIQGRYSGSTFYSLYNAAGQKAVYNISGGAGAYYIEQYDFTGIKEIRFVSNANEAAQRNIQVISE